MSVANLLEIEDLSVAFEADTGWVTAVDQVCFAVAPGRTLGIVGESGSGKSVTSLAIMGLLPPKGTRATGMVRLEGRDILGLDAASIRDLRGNVISMIFQEPMTSLNPAYRVGDQIAEAVLRHRGGSRTSAAARALEMLRRVGIPAPERRYHDYPHKLSGGMRQRVMIAIALACDPQVLIADEPTTALDVTIQAQILLLMRELREDTGAATVLISHDLGVIAEVCDDVVVMYAGQVVERARVEAIFDDPQHPYTLGLLGSLPHAAQRGEVLPVIQGTVPALDAMPSGCRFRGRCPFHISRCAEPPPMVDLGRGRASRCWRAPLDGIVQ